MSLLTIGRITWPSNFRLLEPGECLPGRPDPWGGESFHSIFGCVGVVDAKVAQLLGLPGVPVDVDGKGLLIEECRSSTSPWITSGFVVIHYGGHKSDGRLAGVVRHIEQIGYYARSSQATCAGAAARVFSQMRDAEAIEWLVARGVPAREAVDRLPEFRKLSVAIQQGSCRPVRIAC